MGPFDHARGFATTMPKAESDGFVRLCVNFAVQLTAMVGKTVNFLAIPGCQIFDSDSRDFDLFETEFEQ